MNILLILLGCEITYLLNNRINTAVSFASKFNNTNIDWFLSGGIKNEDTITEAEKMAHKIVKYENKSKYNRSKYNRWKYVYDTQSTNTAENFIMVRNYLNKNNKYHEIYVITSLFHYERAKKIANKILDVEIKWILGQAKLDDSYFWERIHIKNYEVDVSKALQKYFDN